MRPGPGGAVRAGGRGSCWGVVRHLERLQLPALGLHKEGTRTSRCTSLPKTDPTGLPVGQVDRVQGPDTCPYREGCVSGGSTEVSFGPPLVEPRVQCCVARGSPSPRLQCRMLRRRHHHTSGRGGLGGSKEPGQRGHGGRRAPHPRPRAGSGAPKDGGH